MHVIGSELGLTQPGMTIVCGDSHTATLGAFGAVASGIGTSQVEHVLATQTLRMPRPRTMAVTVRGTPRPGTSAKDLALAITARIGTDDGTAFDREAAVDAAGIGPQASWGTNPGPDDRHRRHRPRPGLVRRPRRAGRRRTRPRLHGPRPGTALRDISVSTVFIGSCTNGRLADLRAAAEVLRGRRVAPSVRALAVPGSTRVKRQAEEEGLDEVFRAAGFEWRSSGCSMCVGMNGDVVEPGAHSASTSNRNFESRQGPGARTHLVSPESAAASAVLGHLAGAADLGEMR